MKIFKLKNLFIFVISMIVFSELRAQNTDPQNAEVRKDVNKITLMTTGRVDFYFTKGSYLYWEGNYNFNERYRYLTNSSRLSNCVGYEQAAGEKWFLGVSAKHQLAYPNSLHSAVAAANISHRGKIGSLLFIKQVGGEYLHLFLQDSLAKEYYRKYPSARISFSLGLGKVFTLAKRPLTVLLYYRLYLNTKMNGIYDKRRFDFSKLRTDITYAVTDEIYLGIFGAIDTEYYYTLGGTDSNGIEFPDYRVNRVNPITGISLNYIIRQKGFDKTVIPGLPFR